MLIGLNENILLSNEEYEKIRTIIYEMKAFVCSFSGPEGLPERYFEVNPKLRFYRVAFELQEESTEQFYYAVAHDLLSYIPGLEDFKEKEEYFNEKRQWSEKNNFKYNKTDFFMEELASTLRMILISDLKLEQI